MKTYVLTVSRVFPSTHKRKGEETYFPMEIICKNKIHTIRSNYDLWAKRIKEVQDGYAILSLRYWSGKPYNSKQVEFCQLDYEDGIGIQELNFGFGNHESISINVPFIFDSTIFEIELKDLAKNDGLSLEDFKEWFKKYDLSKPMAIIHFTKFRY